jgi:hypothetical protein
LAPDLSVRRGANSQLGDVATVSQQEANMSLDDTSHPGRPGLDELVPSRYALKVGAIDVLVVSDGVLTLPGKTQVDRSGP